MTAAPNPEFPKQPNRGTAAARRSAYDCDARSSRRQRLRGWLNGGLNRRLLLGTGAGLLASSLFFLVLFVGLFREQLQTERTEAAEQIAALLGISLKNPSLPHDLPALQDIVSRLGEQPSVLSVQIANPAGDVRVASDLASIGRSIPAPAPDRPGPRTRLIEHNATETLRSIQAVPNQPACQQCHGPLASSPLTGILQVDYDAASIRARARETTLMLMAAGSLIVVLNLAGGWWFMRRFVVRPLGRLAATSHRISNGELGLRTGIDGSDEIGAVGRAVDRMADSLAARIDQLAEKERFLQSLIDAIPDGLRVIDREYRVVLTNRRYQAQRGESIQSWSAEPENPPEPGQPSEPAEKMPIACYRDAHERDQPCAEALMTCPLREIDRHGQPVRVVHRHRRRDGGHQDVEIYAAPMQVDTAKGSRRLVVESIRDLSQEVRFSHEQKLSELGRLAAGVAHEIHNPMTSVRFALHAAREANDDGAGAPGQVAEYLELVDREVDKCWQVTQRLLRLSIPAPAQSELIEVAPVVDDTLQLMAWEAEQAGVTLALTPPGASLRILAADSDLRMISLNLVQNALHAMPDGGSLRVEIARVANPSPKLAWPTAVGGQGLGLGAADRADEPDTKQVGRLVELRFRDTGVGIDPQAQLRIFEPFFSRRADGQQGTGLGLAITRSLVEAHRGRILVDSAPGKGTCFCIRFPDADG